MCKLQASVKTPVKQEKVHVQVASQSIRSNMELKKKKTTIFCEENGSHFLIFYFVEKQLSK